ncbi:MAG: hypothetical protein IJJ33_20640, partial [Victivallales bacterium]|nr:hypothetical protein [Victivallales bacterium]
PANSPRAGLRPRHTTEGTRPSPGGGGLVPGTQCRRGARSANPAPPPIATAPPLSLLCGAGASPRSSAPAVSFSLCCVARSAFCQPRRR